jgi:DNA-binding transcriptional ArsR family regulator
MSNSPFSGPPWPLTPEIRAKYPQSNPDPHRLRDVLFGKIRGRVLALLLGHPEKCYYIHQIAEITETSAGNVRRELEILSEVGLVRRSKEGNRVYYQGPEKFDRIGGHVWSLIALTAGILPELRSALEPLRGSITYALECGRIGIQAEDASNVINLLLVGDGYGLRREEISKALMPFEHKVLTHRVHVTVYTLRQFLALLEGDRHMVWNMRFHTWLVGDEDKFRQLVNKADLDWPDPPRRKRKVVGRLLRSESPPPCG